ncbi:MAG: aminotransferase class IV [Candidatus Adiutrix sp.]
MTISILKPNDFLLALVRGHKPFHDNYLAMYSSQWGGIVTDPSLWLVPIDDHMVHRGDAVFEVFKCINGRAYLLDDHLEKLEKTARHLAITIPLEFLNIHEILAATIKAGGHKNVLVRLTISRGPGGFTSSPYESPMGLLLITVLKLSKPLDEKYEKGVTVITAPFQAKDLSIATMKTTSYLQNVLLKKAALDAGADYGVCFGPDNFMTESATENVFIVTKNGALLAPHWETILRGSTLTRVMALGAQLVKEGFLTAVAHENITQDMVYDAAEALISSTTTDVLPISYWNNRPIGSGKGGPIGQLLLSRLRAEYTDANSPHLRPMWLD